MKKSIILAMGAMVFLAGCGLAGDDSAKVPVKPKWPGPPYHIAFETKAAKPNPAGVTIPSITYKGNPEALENPDLINSEPYGAGWLLRVRLDDPRELEELISEEEYAELTTEV